MIQEDNSKEKWKPPQEAQDKIPKAWGKRTHSLKRLVAMENMELFVNY